MLIGSIRHKSLRRFAEDGVSRGLPSGSVDRLLRMLFYIDAIGTADELRVPPNFGAHQLTGDRKGLWSLTVTKNWRMVFRVTPDSVIEDMDLEDYH